MIVHKLYAVQGKRGRTDIFDYYCLKIFGFIGCTTHVLWHKLLACTNHNNYNKQSLLGKAQDMRIVEAQKAKRSIMSVLFRFIFCTYNYSQTAHIIPSNIHPPQNLVTSQIVKISRVFFFLFFFFWWAEYGCMLKITEKSDVYSYGVVLLEIITGKRPVDASFGDGQHVIEWVRGHLKRKKDPLEIVDPKLQGHPDTHIQEMLQALGISLLCTSNRPDERPTMKDVAALLREIRHDPPAGLEAHKPKPTTTNTSSSSLPPAQLLLLHPSPHSSSLAYSSSSLPGCHQPPGRSS